MAFFLIFTLLFGVFANNCFASDSEDLRQAQKAYDVKDYQKALNYLQPLVKKGNKQAEFELGTMYELGHGVPQSISKAMELYKRASSTKSPMHLSVHLTYTNKPDNPAKQFKIWLKQAMDGDSLAQNDVGYCYLKGIGTKIDYAEAKKWLKEAVKQNNDNAMVNLGFMYQNGAGIEQDLAKAAKLYEQASNMNNIVAKNNLGVMYVRGLAFAPNYNEAAKLFKDASDAGNVDALSNLGYLYQNGFGVPKDMSKAVRYYLKSAGYGNAAARYNLGYMYQTGNGVNKNYAKAARLYELAAKDGYPEAQNCLGFMYQNGIGVPKDYKLALKYYKDLAKKRQAMMMPVTSLENYGI